MDYLKLICKGSGACNPSEGIGCFITEMIYIIQKLMDLLFYAYQNIQSLYFPRCHGGKGYSPLALPDKSTTDTHIYYTYVPRP